MPIKSRQPAPAFALVAGDGAEISTSGLLGTPTVLHFYPDPNRSLTYAFVEALPKLRRLGAHAFAVSNERVVNSTRNTIPPSHQLTDPTGEMIAAYDAMGLHQIYGQHVPGILPSAVLIGADGKVVLRWPRVVFREHFAKVIERVERLVARASR